MYATDRVGMADDSTATTDPTFLIESTEDVADSATPGESTEPALVPQYTVHPAAEYYPMMTGKPYAELVEDIRKNGLQHPIVVRKGQILDGRNRAKACPEAGVALKTVEFEGDEQEAVAFIHSANLHRRHLTHEQKLDVVKKLLAAHPEFSDRRVAKIADVHHETVGAKRADLVRRGGTRHVAKRKDSKGRSYSAPPAPAIDLAAKRKASAVIAFSQALHEGDINLHLNTLLKILGDEKQRITELPKIKRESFVRGVMAVADITLDDLRPSAGVPVFEGALH
jgi:hypothetical protein